MLFLYLLDFALAMNVKEPESKDKSVKTPAVKSFSHYQSTKGKQWKLKVSKNTVKEVPKEVFINIGLMQWCSQEHCFKVKRGKKIVLRVEPEVTYISLLIEAESKWKDFHKNLYNQNQSYLLLYEDGAKAEYMPGSESDLFTLKKYHEEVRKDYKRITLYLATDEDFQLSIDEGNASQDFPVSKESDSDDEKLSHSPFEISGSDKKQCSLKSKQPRSTSTCSSPIDLTIEPPAKCKPSTSFTALQSQLDNIVELDNELAIQLQEMFDGECSNNLNVNLGNNIDDASQESVMQSINLNVDTSGQFFVVIRHGADVFRKLSIWKREAKKSHSGSHPLRISYVGEQGIDTGAMSKEFFTETVAEIGSTIFPNGCPVDSTFHIQNGNLRTCGNIIAASLAQGGPAPHFMDESAYNLMINPNVDLQKLDKERHLTEYDRTLLQSVRDDIVSNTDTIIDCGYTGPIDEAHIEDIINSIVVSIVSKRLMCLQEFVEGLNQFGVAASIRLYPDIFKVLFTLESQPTDKVDANYIFSVLAPQYSMIGKNNSPFRNS